MRKVSSAGWGYKVGRGKTAQQDTVTYSQHVPTVLALRNPHRFTLSYSLSYPVLPHLAGHQDLPSQLLPLLTLLFL